MDGNEKWKKNIGEEVQKKYAWGRVSLNVSVGCNMEQIFVEGGGGGVGKQNMWEGAAKNMGRVSAEFSIPLPQDLK